MGLCWADNERYCGAMDDYFFVWYLLSGWAVSGVIGYFVGSTKGRGGDGAIWGVLLGPIGWLVVLCGEDRRKSCPYCGGIIPQGPVKRCKNCGKNLMQRSTAGGALDPVEQWSRQQEMLSKPLPPPPPGWKRGGGDDE